MKSGNWKLRVHAEIDQGPTAVNLFQLLYVKSEEKRLGLLFAIKRDGVINFAQTASVGKQIEPQRVTLDKHCRGRDAL